MAAKPETTFTKSILKHLPKTVYHMKNNNQYISGIPDLWVSGKCGDCWIEMKYLPRVPSRVNVDPMRLLTPLQASWLRDRRMEGRNVAVIIGCPAGGIVLTDRLWELELTIKQFTALLRSKEELASWILEQVT